MKVTFVKKIKADGSPCKKCAEVSDRLEQGGLMGKIARTVIADERDPSSEGMTLAAQFGVDIAPFFIVEAADGKQTIYTSFIKLQKEVLDAKASDEEEAKDFLARNSDLDFL